VPGAAVEVRVQTGMVSSVRGTGVSADGGLAVFLSPPTGPNEVLIARQTACGTTGSDSSSPAATDPGKTLKSPSYLGQLFECENAIPLGNVAPGAVVTVQRAGGAQTGLFTRDAIDFPLTSPLVKNESIMVSQAFPACGASSPTPQSTKVVASLKPGRTSIVGPICPGATTVEIESLFGGAQVRIFRSSTIIGVGEVPPAIDPKDPAFPFLVAPPLGPTDVITAEQLLCGKWSDPSNPVTVLAQPASAPVVAAPLFQCGGAVRVAGVQPGAWVYLWSDLLKAPIGQTLAFSNQVDVRVSPTLLNGDHIHAELHGCGGAVTSTKVLVGIWKGDLTGPTVVQTVSGMTAVGVQKVVPGAFVEVQVNGAWGGGKFCTQATDSVPISVILQVDDLVKARQTLCAISSFGGVVKTVPPPPVACFKPTPVSGKVPLVVQVSDCSTGAITSWGWNFGDGSSSNVQHPAPHQFSNPGIYTITLITTGPGGSNSVSFSVKALHQPPTALFSAAPLTGSAPQAVHFNESSAGNPTSWNWDFGDGQTSNAQNPPDHLYTKLGTFHVSLVVSNDGGNSAPFTQAIHITQIRPLILVVVTPADGDHSTQFDIHCQFFAPNDLVTITVSNGVNTVPFTTSSGVTGVFLFTSVDETGICTGNTALQWRAHDSRMDPANPAIPLWSNTANTQC
jgi:PKD repeat protein